MTATRLTTFALLLFTIGCERKAPVVTVEVIDTSASITPRAARAALDAVGEQISQMGRGDCLILIPITGDAQNDAGGRILRLSAPTTRESYDADLRRFQVQAQKQFSAWVASLDQHQPRTDILGTLDVARQELATLPKDSSSRLIIVSDFLEDESAYRFITASQLAHAESAKALARKLKSDRGFALQGAPVCLGHLESSDFAPLSAERKQAVQAFWTEYLTEQGRTPQLHYDGTGLLTGADGCFNRPTHVATN